jgi:AraC family chitin signaling transcriptional activator
MLFFLLLSVINHLYQVRYYRQKEKIDKEAKKELALMKLENEKEIVILKNDNLNNEVEAINKELASTAMAIVKKNELLNTIKYKLQQEKDNHSVKSALKIIDENMENNTDWKSFQEAFNNTDRDFLKKLKALHPLLTPSDLKLCVYLRLNLSSKEIAPMLNISAQSIEIKRFRLRKKMDLGHEQNLTEYILNI